MTLFYCDHFENNLGICTIVEAKTEAGARREATDQYYGKPARVRRATDDDVHWFDVMSGRLAAKPPSIIDVTVVAEVRAQTGEAAVAKVEDKLSGTSLKITSVSSVRRAD